MFENFKPQDLTDKNDTVEENAEKVVVTEAPVLENNDSVERTKEVAVELTVEEKLEEALQRIENKKAHDKKLKEKNSKRNKDKGIAFVRISAEQENMIIALAKRIREETGQKHTRNQMLSRLLSKKGTEAFGDMYIQDIKDYK